MRFAFYRLHAASIIVGCILCSNSEVRMQQGPTRPSQVDYHLAADPSFEVLGAWGCGLGGLVISEGAGVRISIDIEALELEEEPVIDTGQGKAAREAQGVQNYKPQLVENVIRWQVKYGSDPQGQGPKDRRNREFEIEVNFKLRDAVRVGHGEFLLLGQSEEGETIIEFWVLDAPHGPDNFVKRWLPAKIVGVGIPLRPLPSSFEIDLSNSKYLGPTAYRKIVFQERLQGLPIALEAFVPGGTLFLLTRDPKTKSTCLSRLEPRKSWTRTTITSSAKVPLLSASMEIEVLPICDSNGYLLAVSGQGFAKINGGRSEYIPVHDVLCLEDRDADGMFEKEQVFASSSEFQRYRRSFD